jgi:hypothetical protein
MLFQFAAAPGPYPVGLEVLEQYDPSRSDRGEHSRPLQILIWYPAVRTASETMTVGAYGDLWSTETSFGEPSAQAPEALASMTPTLAMSLRAVRAAPRSPGRFPVVVYAPSFSSVSWENADLCEYVASHGYVAIASPSLGPGARAMTMDLAGLNAQAADIAYLIAHAHTLANADVRRIAVTGFSWGGLSGLFAAARDSRIGAVIALDGSQRYFPGLVQAAGDVHPEQMRIPLLYFAQRNYSMEVHDRYSSEPGRQGPNVLNAWAHGDLLFAHMLGLSHEEFGSMFQRSEDMWRTLFQDHALMKGDYGREDGITGYAWVARYVVQFLDAYLKQNAASLDFLQKTPAENGVPRHVMAVMYRRADSEAARQPAASTPQR